MRIPARRDRGGQGGHRGGRRRRGRGGLVRRGGRGSSGLVARAVLRDGAVPLGGAGDEVDVVDAAGVGVLALLPVGGKLVLVGGRLLLGLGLHDLDGAVPLGGTGHNVDVVGAPAAGVLALLPVLGKGVVVGFFSGSFFGGLGLGLLLYIFKRILLIKKDL